MFALWKRYAPYAIGGIVVVVLAAAGWNWMKAQEKLKAQERGRTFLAAESGGAEAYRALAETTEGLPGVIAQLRLADSLAEAGDRTAATEAYDNAAKATTEVAYADLAKLQALRESAAQTPPSELIEALGPLTEEGAPYRALALELRAIVAMNAGDTDAARADLRTILTDPGTSAETRSRAEQILVLVAGK